MAAIDDLVTALASVNTAFDAIVSGVADDTQGGKIRNAVARAILTDLMPVAKSVSHSDFDYVIATLQGRSASELAAHYPQLSSIS